MKCLLHKNSFGQQKSNLGLIWKETSLFPLTPTPPLPPESLCQIDAEVLLPENSRAARVNKPLLLTLQKSKLTPTEVSWPHLSHTDRSYNLIKSYSRVKVITHFFFWLGYLVYCPTPLFTTFRKRKKGKITEWNGLSTVFSACHFHYNYLNHLFCLEQAKEFDINKLLSFCTTEKGFSNGTLFQEARVNINFVRGFVSFSEVKCQ